MAILTVVPEENSQIVFKCQQMVISLAGITSAGNYRHGKNDDCHGDM